MAEWTAQDGIESPFAGQVLDPEPGHYRLAVGFGLVPMTLGMML
jgi:hypothetical protein